MRHFNSFARCEGTYTAVETEKPLGSIEAGLRNNSKE
jgi:hypothetical protein